MQRMQLAVALRMLLGLAFVGCSSALLAPATIPNFRDVGGMPAASGRVMATGLLHRSASPANASRADADEILQTLKDLTVLDLRGTQATDVNAGCLSTGFPCRFLGDGGKMYV